MKYNTFNRGYDESILVFISAVVGYSGLSLASYIIVKLLLLNSALKNGYKSLASNFGELGLIAQSIYVLVALLGLWSFLSHLKIIDKNRFAKCGNFVFYPTLYASSLFTVILLFIFGNIPVPNCLCVYIFCGIDRRLG